MNVYLDALKSLQNPDGGWGYYPGKPSWLEPTVWAALALHGDPAADRAWNLVRGWQLPTGAWRASATVPEESWASSLAVTLHCVRGVEDEAWRKGVGWLISTKGTTAGWWDVFMGWLASFKQEISAHDPTLAGWPWRDGNASWVEPTVHAVVALRQSAQRFGGESLNERLKIGEKLLLDRRCSDGGWNYGNTRVLGEDLASYPECTALGLIGLCGSKGYDLRRSYGTARKYWDSQIPAFGRAQLRVAMRLHEAGVREAPPAPVEACHETIHIAFEALGQAGGNWKLLRAPEGV